MTRIMLVAAAAVAISGAASANTSNVYLKGSSVHVRYQDLDLNSPRGRAQLHDRIDRGARLLCAGSDDSYFRAYLSPSDCYRVVVADAVEQMKQIARR